MPLKQRPSGNGLRRDIPIGKIRTQKGRGVVALAQSGQPWSKIPAFAIAQEPLDIPRCLTALFPHGVVDGNFEVFARPMPITPMHGFVDSRLVTTNAGLVALWEETRTADPQGELMLMTPIPADLNLIVHPGAIIIGRGHDGATAGHGCVTIPLLGKLSDNWRALATAATVKSHEWPFFELVIEGQHIWYTQMRGGPAMPLDEDYIPAFMTVEHVVQATGDLLEWKAICDTMQPGTAVAHVHGSIGSHYGVHCIEHKIPILTTRMPVVGETLKPTTVLPPYDLEALRTGVVAGTLVDLKPRESRHYAVQFVLLCMHSAPRMRRTSAFWFGAACALMERLGVAAALGEWRHAGRHGGTTPFHAMGRDQVYTAAFPDPFPYRKLLPGALYSFEYGKWSGGGFGGKKWGECARSVVELDMAIMSMMLEPQAATASALVQALNNAVNKAHNNGWWMNKFIDADAFNRAARYEYSTIHDALPIIFDLLRIGQDQEQLRQLGRQWLLTSELPQTKEALKQLGARISSLEGPAVFGSLTTDKSMFSPLKLPVQPTKPATTITLIQFRLVDNKFHIQFQHDGSASGKYGTYDQELPLGTTAVLKQAIAENLLNTTTSLAGSGTTYYIPLWEVLDLKHGVFKVALSVPGQKPFLTVELHT